MSDSTQDFVTDELAQHILRLVVQKLRKAREHNGISMYRVAKLTGLHASTIGLVERGERSPSVFVVIKIAQALGLPLGSIITECELAVARSTASTSEPPDEQRGQLIIHETVPVARPAAVPELVTPSCAHGDGSPDVTF